MGVYELSKASNKVAEKDVLFSKISFLRVSINIALANPCKGYNLVGSSIAILTEKIKDFYAVKTPFGGCPNGKSDYLTAIFFVADALVLGITTSKTPSLQEAVRFSLSIFSGSVKLRWNFP